MWVATRLKDQAEEGTWALVIVCQVGVTGSWWPSVL